MVAWVELFWVGLGGAVELVQVVEVSVAESGLGVGAEVAVDVAEDAVAVRYKD